MSTRPVWSPTIALARRIGQELGADCMILVRSESGRWAGASWGRTRARCADLGRIMDGLFDDGRLDGGIDRGDERAVEPSRRVKFHCSCIRPNPCRCESACCDESCLNCGLAPRAEEPRP